jgi:hypothetical protein
MDQPIDGHKLSSRSASDHLQKLFDERDWEAPGPPEEDRACLAILDVIMGGGRPGTVDEE